VFRGFESYISIERSVMIKNRLFALLSLAVLSSGCFGGGSTHTTVVHHVNSGLGWGHFGGGYSHNQVVTHQHVVIHQHVVTHVYTPRSSSVSLSKSSRR
jgi:hypothetical protein